MTRSIVIGACAAVAFLGLIVLLVVPRQAFGFGGEDVVDGKPWHHEDITKRGLTKSQRYEGAGFSDGAAAAIAWHADYIDSYLYNPLFWAQGIADERGLARLDAALAGYENLAKLHFDDTSTTAGLRANFQRYASGTLAGLYWASLQGARGDLEAGQNILGVSFHAVQDFYSHSSWVDDPDRRCKTWFQVAPNKRTGMTLYSGAYELPRSSAPAHHGAYSLSCSLVRGKKIDKVLDPVCTGKSPFQNTALCEEWRVCGGSHVVTISVKGEQNDNLVFLSPPGIALDTTWLARVQAGNRRLVDPDGTFAPGKDGMHFRREACKEIVNAAGRPVCKLDADQIFAGTKDLAIRATTEWALYLETAMKAMGVRQGEFWQRLKSEGSAQDAWPRQYEDFSKLPYQFLAAGPYPSANPSTPERESATDADGWYLRLRLKTAAAPLAETDSNIYARVRVNGKDENRLLDYLPTDDKKGRADNRLLVYDDFESGRDTVYMLGPFNAKPESVALYNDSGSALKALSALATDVTNAASGAVTSARRALISLLAGNADYVGDAFTYRTFDQISAKFAAAPRQEFPTYEETVRISGGDEGVHDIVYRVRSLPDNLTPIERQQGWLAMEVELRKLVTIAESKVDRLSTSDDPFIIFHVAPLNGRNDKANTYLTDPAHGMDSGEEFVYPRKTGSAVIVKIPPGGGLVVSAQVFESDSESLSDRQQLARTFASGYDEKTRAPAAKFADEIGRMLGADWTPDFVEIFAFKRGAIPWAGPVLARRPLSEVRGGQVSPPLMLNWADVRPLLAASNAIDAWSAKPVDAKVLDGEWHARGYQCEKPLSHDAVDVAVDGQKLDAKELQGTRCLKAGAPSWRGTFENGIIAGEFFNAPPPPQTAGTAAAAEDDAIELPPHFDDTSIDPMMPLEGNWMIEWQGAQVPAAYAVLSKGAIYDCTPRAEGGCWYTFKRDTKAKWTAAATVPPTGTTGGVTIAASQLTIKYPYGVPYSGGGTSNLTAAGDVIAGQWAAGGKKGRETWRRVRANVTELESSTESVRRPVATPVTVTVPYVDARDDLRGNRPGAELRLYGKDLWGLHHFWLPASRDVEITGLAYICKYDGKNGYPRHLTYGVCLHQGGVEGVVLSLKIWPLARSGPQTLHFDDQNIVFNLNLTGEENRPKPVYGWRPMKLEMTSCSALKEIDVPPGQTPLVFTRSDFRRR